MLALSGLPACRGLLAEPVPAVPTVVRADPAPTAFASLARAPSVAAEAAAPPVVVRREPNLPADPPPVMRPHPGPVVVPSMPVRQTPIEPPIAVSPAIPTTTNPPVLPTEPIEPPIPDPYTALTGAKAEPPSAPPYMPPLMPVGPPATPDPPLVAAVRAYLNDNPEKAVEHLKSLDGPNQELMLQLIPAVVRASRMDLTHASPTELGLLSGQLRGPAEAMAERSPLILERVCFCRWVKNFGRYDPLPPGHTFRPGSLAELYVEVRNVPSVATQTSAEGDGFVTELACTLQVTDATGTVVPLTDRNRRLVPALTDTKRDFTRSPIRDYFLLFRFPLPDRAGEYTVTVKVLDPAGGREVSRTLTKVRVQ